MKFLFAVAALLPLTLASPPNKRGTNLEPRAPTPTVECGTRGSKPCPADKTCVALPNSFCGPANDCGGYCSPLPQPTETKYPKITCGGFVPSDQRVTCPKGQICTIPPDSPCYDGTVTDCTGVCVGAPCGGFRTTPYPSCPDDQTCVRRPSQPDEDEVADLPGICVFKKATCGSKLGGKCPSEWDCVDNPGDSCFPHQGAKDCSGICSFNETVSGNAGGDPPK